MLLPFAFLRSAAGQLVNDAPAAVSLSPAPAEPAIPTKYDFAWEGYAIRLAPRGRSFYAFRDGYPVGIIVQDEGGRPAMVPVVFGAAARAADAAFQRYLQSQGAGSMPFASAGASRRATVFSGKNEVRQPEGDPRFTRVALPDGTVVYFDRNRFLVSTPHPFQEGGQVTSDFFLRPRANGLLTSSSACADVTICAHLVTCQRTGPLWDGIRDLVLNLALGRAKQASAIADSRPGLQTENRYSSRLVSDVELLLDRG